MTKEFFYLTDSTIKLRRNLLFLSTLTIIHFLIVSLDKVKIFNVSIPNEFLNIGLPAMMIWFALNYFYHLYAEYTQWRASFLENIDVPDNYTDKSWKHYTLVSEISHITNGAIGVRTEFSSAKGYGGSVNPTKEEVAQDLKEIMGYIDNQIMSAIKTDIARIDEFQNIITRFNFLNRMRFYILDNAVPLILSLTSLLLAIKKLFF